jgi:hypothetical protein
VQEEAPDELIGVESHDLGFEFVLAAVVLPLKGDLAVLLSEQPFVGEGDSMCITAQIFDGLLWAAEGRFGVHHPIDFA